MTTVTTMQKVSFTAGFVAAMAAGVVLGCGTDQWRWAVPQKATSAFPALAHIPFGPGEELEYEFGWNGIPAATLVTSLSSSLRDGNESLVFTYRGETAAALSYLYTFEASGETCTDPRTLQPNSSKLSTRTKNKEKGIETRFDWQQGVAEAKMRKVRRGKLSEKEVSQAVGLDIPSALLLARATDVPPENTCTFRVVNGDNAYEITVTRVGTADIEVPAGAFKTVQYDVGVRGLTQQQAEDEDEPVQYRSVRIWIGGESRMPVRLEADLSFGHLYAELTRFRKGTAR